jgi:hypothetical protein
MSEFEVGFIHLRDYITWECGCPPTLNPKGGVTVCFTVEEGFTVEDEMIEVIFAIAECSSKDHYSRRRGRQISEGRLRSGKAVRSFLESISKGQKAWAVARRALYRELGHG